MTGDRARKLCSWRDEKDQSKKCRNLAVTAPNGENFRCDEHLRGSWVRGGDKNRAVPALTQDEKDYIRERDFHVCRVCGEPAIEVDHIDEVADGGANDQNNLQLLCGRHHREKTIAAKMRRHKGGGQKVSARANAKRRYRRMGLYQQ